MTTNQTIDGVPRDLLEQAVAQEKVRPRLEGRNNTCVGCGNWMPYGHQEAHEHEDGCPEEIAAKQRHWVSQLRALLDAPASFTVNKCGVQMVDCPECTHQWDHFFECANQPAAQAQGELLKRKDWPHLAAVVDTLAQPQGKPVCWVNDQRLLLCGKSPREAEPKNPMVYNPPLYIAGSALRTDYCNTPLYAEQPAPVAVVLPDLWQPIETAPKDGTEIILRKGDRVTSGAWTEWSKSEAEHHGTTGAYLGQVEYDSGALWASWDGGFCDDDHPTHWQPLPTATRQQ